MLNIGGLLGFGSGVFVEPQASLAVVRTEIDDADIFENGQVLAVITIRLPSETKKPVSMIQVPLNLFLPAGVNVDGDGDMAQNFPFQTCNANSCFVGFPICDALLKRMLNGANSTSPSSI